MTNQEKDKRFFDVYHALENIKEVKNGRYRIGCSDTHIVLAEFDHVWGGDKKYKDIRKFPIEIDTDTLVRDIKGVIDEHF